METCPHFFAEEFSAKEIERPFEIGKGNIGVHGQPLNLMEHRGVAGVGVVAAIDPARGQDVEWRAVFSQGADLHRRGVRAQDGLRIHVKRVHVVARGVRRRDVQRVEVVVGGLDFRAGLNRVAQAEKNILDFSLHAGNGMNRAQPPAIARKREVGGA